MKITKKTTMKEWPKVEFVLEVSRQDIFEEVSKFPIPERVGEYHVIAQSDIKLKNMLELWEISDRQTLWDATCRSFLGIDYTEKLPMIDFLRLVIHAEDTAKKAKARFDEVKTDLTSEDKKVGADKVSNPEYRMLEVYRSAHGYQDVNDVYEISWWMIYLYFKKLKDDYEIDKKRNELRERANK